MNLQYFYIKRCVNYLNQLFTLCLHLLYIFLADLHVDPGFNDNAVETCESSNGAPVIRYVAKNTGALKVGGIEGRLAKNDRNNRGTK